jgi:hypothetical protein
MTARRASTAIAALAVPVAIAVLAVLPGCGTSVPFRPLRSGQCLPASAQVVGRREQQPPTVACSAPHRYEVYATPTLSTGDDWPGQDEVDAAAKQLCYDRFAPDTGHDPITLPDGVKELTIGPSQSGYTKSHDRRVECLVVLPKDRSGAFVRPGGGTEST